MNTVYVAVWHTEKPKMVCLLDIVPAGKGIIRSMALNPVLSYSKAEFHKYSANYQIASRARYENLHGEIKYP